MDEVEDHPYFLGEVEFGSLTYGEDPLDPPPNPQPTLSLSSFFP